MTKVLGQKNHNVAETEIMIAAMQAYREVGLKNLVLKVNDRRALSGIIEYVGFDLADANRVCVSLDKLDKIGEEKVVEELVRNFEQMPNIQATP